MEVRILGSSDAAAFKTLRLAALRECPTAFSSSYEEERDIPLEQTGERLNPNRDAAVFGAFSGDNLVGTVGIYRENARKLAHKAVIWGVYVAPAFRGRGVARALLQRVLAHAAAMPNLLQVTLGVNTENAAAIGLYRSEGFEPFGVERGFMLVDGVLYDEIHMARRVDEARSPESTIER